MHLHEYQAKILLKKFKVLVPDFVMVSNHSEIGDAIKKLGVSQAAVKVQVHAGGRGKAGGVKIAKNPQQIETFAKELLGKVIITPQTGSEGVVANEILISPLVELKKEYYLAVTIDRKLGQAVIICSPEGGMDIEEVAAKNPDKILKTPIPLEGHLRSYHLLEISKFMGWKERSATQGTQLCQALVKAFLALDASLIEINPLAELADGTLTSLDAKMSIDDNALFRQPDLLVYRDQRQSSPLEAAAEAHELAYIALQGDIGCMVNGAGLAMATMDIIAHYGGKPANFLDVGGGASQEKIAQGFKILLEDPKVKAVLVNIFGGIMNCQTLAAGMIDALKEKRSTLPLIVRMEGTNVEEGRKLLLESGFSFDVVNNLTEAAKKAVARATGA